MQHCVLLNSGDSHVLAGVELSSKKKKVLWPLEPDDEVEDDLEKTLELRQVSL